MKNYSRKTRGITMIALVITIIVLLILAGVTVATLTGDNGLLQKATNAKEETEIGEEKELIERAVIVAEMNIKINNSNGLTKSILDEALKNQGATSYRVDDVDEGLAVTLKSKRTYLVDNNETVVYPYTLKIAESEPEKSNKNIGTMSYGVMEIEFLNGNGYTVTNTPNYPTLKNGMKEVYWAKDESGTIDTNNYQNNTYEMTNDKANFNESNWYNYNPQEGNADGKTSRWANALTSDGSYYVWIPRYAYRIIYFTKAEYENAYRGGTLSEEEALQNGYIVGYSDARGIVNYEGKRPANVNSVTSVSVNEKYFRTHPVFDGNVETGGWDSKIKGIWVMKYKASNFGATSTDKGTSSGVPMSLPNVKVTGHYNVSRVFTRCLNAYSNLNSHLLKNSEWGAMAYLAESKYGRNGAEISSNQCSDMISGTGRGLGNNNISNSTYSWSGIDESQKYNGQIGQLSSTTGNIYGIYDVATDLSETTMGFAKDNEGNCYIQETGFNGKKADGNFVTNGNDLPEKKYYESFFTTESGINLGNAMAETRNWNGDTFYWVGPSWCHFSRGSKNGIYSVDVTLGYKMGDGMVFRMCLIIDE